MSAPVPATEQTNAATRDLDTKTVNDLVKILAREQTKAVLAVEKAAPELAVAVDAIVKALSHGGSLHYVGAGTSGRLAMLDAAECPPTFGTPASLVVAHVAGGTDALVRAVENAEDDVRAGDAEMASITAKDVVVGISASGSAPYVIAALERARASGACTIGIANVAGSALVRDADIAVVLETGPEPIAGSTRLKAGTAQKLALNTLSTAAMVRLGRVYDNLMVDVVATNAKLRTRALKLVMQLANVEEAHARTLLDVADGHVKIAVVIARRHVSAAEARALLEEHGGFLRALL